DLRSAISSEGASWRVPYHWIRNYVAHDLLVPLKGSKIRLRDDDYEVVNGQAQTSISELSKAGYAVVGGLEELAPSPIDQGSVNPDDVDDEELRNIASAVIPSMLKRLQEQSETEDQLRTRLQSRNDQMVRLQANHRSGKFSANIKRILRKARSNM